MLFWQNCLHCLQLPVHVPKTSSTWYICFAWCIHVLENEISERMQHVAELKFCLLQDMSAILWVGIQWPGEWVSAHTRITLRWRHNGHDGISNHQSHHCLLIRLFRRRSKKTSKPRVTGLCAGKSSVTREFSAQKASSAKNVSIWLRHHKLAHLMSSLNDFPVSAQNWNYKTHSHTKIYISYFVRDKNMFKQLHSIVLWNAISHLCHRQIHFS